MPPLLPPEILRKIIAFEPRQKADPAELSKAMAHLKGKVEALKHTVKTSSTSSSSSTSSDLVMDIHQLSSLHFSQGTHSHFTIQGAWLQSLFMWRVGLLTNFELATMLETCRDAEGANEIENALQKFPGHAMSQISNIHFYLVPLEKNDGAVGKKQWEQEVTKPYKLAQQAFIPEVKAAASSLSSSGNSKGKRSDATKKTTAPLVKEVAADKLGTLDLFTAWSTIKKALDSLDIVGVEIKRQDEAFIEKMVGKNEALKFYRIKQKDQADWNSLVKLCDWLHDPWDIGTRNIRAYIVCQALSR